MDLSISAFRYHPIHPSRDNSFIESKNLVDSSSLLNSSISASTFIGSFVVRRDRISNIHVRDCILEAIEEIFLKCSKCSFALRNNWPDDLFNSHQTIDRSNLFLWFFNSSSTDKKDPSCLTSIEIAVTIASYWWFCWLWEVAVFIILKKEYIINSIRQLSFCKNLLFVFFLYTHASF